MSYKLPNYVTKYFWGDDISKLSWTKHKKYIIQTLLDKGDIKSLRWLLKRVRKSELKSLLPELNLQPKSNNFWSIYLS